MRKIMLVLFIFCFTICFAQFPEASFRSVNRENTYINYTPPITPVGAPLTQNTYNGPRRVGRTDDPGDPFATPIEDVHFMSIFLFVIIYVLYKRKTLIE